MSNYMSRPTRLTHNGTTIARFHARQLRMITGHGSFAHAYQSRPDVYPNYI